MKQHFQNTTTAAGIPAVQPTRRLLEQTRLSRLPSWKQNAAFCVGCQAKLTTDNRPLENFKICRKCMNAYALIDLELNEGSEKKSRNARLARMQQKLAFQE